MRREQILFDDTFMNNLLYANPLSTEEEIIEVVEYIEHIVIL